MRAGVVDQHVDAGLGGGDLGGGPSGLGHAGQVGVHHAVGKPGTGPADSRQGVRGALPVAGDEDDSRALPCEVRRRHLADARRAPSEHNHLAVHRKSP